MEPDSRGDVNLVAHKSPSILFMNIPHSLPRPEVAKLVPLEVAVQLQVVPLAMEDGVLTVAVASPDAFEAIDALVEITGYRVFPVLSPADQLEAALERLRALCYDECSTWSLPDRSVA
jgi:hypothetical protein